MRSDVVVADKGWPTPSSGANVLLAHVSKREAPSGIEALIRRHITYERLEDAVIPIHVMATDVLTGAATTLLSQACHIRFLSSAHLNPVEVIRWTQYSFWPNAVRAFCCGFR